MGRFDQMQPREELDILPDEILVLILDFACTSIIEELQGTGRVPGQYCSRSFAKRLSSFRALQLVCHRFYRLFNERCLRQARELVIQAQVTRLSSVMDTLCAEKGLRDRCGTMHTPSTLEWCCGAFWYNPQLMRNLKGRLSSDLFSVGRCFSVGLKMKLLCLAPKIWSTSLKRRDSLETNLGEGDAEWEMPQTHRGGAAVFRFGNLVFTPNNFDQNLGYASYWYGCSVLSYRLLSKVDREEDREYFREGDDYDGGYNSDYWAEYGHLWDGEWSPSGDCEINGVPWSDRKDDGRTAREHEKPAEVVEEKEVGQVFDGEYWLWYHPKSRQDLSPLEGHAEWYLVDTLQQRVFMHGLQKWFESDGWEKMDKGTGSYYHTSPPMNVLGAGIF